MIAAFGRPVVPEVKMYSNLSEKFIGAESFGACLEHARIRSSKSEALNSVAFSPCPVLYKLHLGRGPNSSTSLMAVKKNTRNNYYKIHHA